MSLLRLATEAPPVASTGSGAKRRDGGRLLLLGLPAVVGISLWLHLPAWEPPSAPATISSEEASAADDARRRLAGVFGATIVAALLDVLPLGALATLALAAAVALDALPLHKAACGFGSEVSWLVLASCFLARAFQSTGLSRRAGLRFLRKFGGSTLSLAYGLCLAEVCLALLLPSSAARSLGLLLPLVASVEREACGDSAAKEVQGLRAFLALTAFHATAHGASLWITGASMNFMALDVARSLGAEVAGGDFVEWLVPASVPAFLGLVATPPVAAVLVGARECRVSQLELPAKAARRLADLPPLSLKECTLAATLAAAAILWSGITPLSLQPAAVGLVATSVLLASGALSWEECAGDCKAWDAFLWLSVVCGLGEQLQQEGAFRSLGAGLAVSLGRAGLGPGLSFAALAAGYFYMHYLFASQASHIAAALRPTAATLVATGCSPKVAALSLAYLSNAFSSLTHYSSAQAAVYFSFSGIPVRSWLKLNFLFSVANLAIWTGAGQLWWRILGLL